MHLTSVNHLLQPRMSGTRQPERGETPPLGGSTIAARGNTAAANGTARRKRGSRGNGDKRQEARHTRQQRRTEARRLGFSSEAAAAYWKWQHHRSKPASKIICYVTNIVKSDCPHCLCLQEAENNMPVGQSPAIEIYNEKDKNDDLEWQPLLVSAPVNPKQQQMQIKGPSAHTEGGSERCYSQDAFPFDWHAHRRSPPQSRGARNHPGLWE